MMRKERLPLLLLVAFAAFVSALPPLHEMDLAQHLANGEWIWRHHGVPFIEPFAWTRAGKPFYAYSWLPELIFYGLLRTFGAFSLHVLTGLIAGASVAAAYWAGRKFGWPLLVSLLAATLHLITFWGLANTLRPQQFLWITLPLAWGICALIQARGPSVARILALVAVGALAANTHIFFVLTAIPVAYFALTAEQPETWIGPALALFASWFITPYALVWPDVFRIYFGHNVLLSKPASVLDIVPGFDYAWNRPGVVCALFVLLALPWIAHTAATRTRREHIVLAGFWTTGLFLFAYAGRLFFVWWMLAFPLVGIAAQRCMELVERSDRRKFLAVLAGGASAIALLAAAPPVSPIFWLFEGDTVHRMLPRGGEDPALWLPSWLLCNTRPGARGRIFTEYNYGSELTWRLPGYSPSIDGRNIFPDSDGVEFSLQPAGRHRAHATTWMHADLALLDRSFWLAPTLDHHPDWVLLAQSRPNSHTGWGALWAKRAWWQQWGTTMKLPADGIHQADARGTCAATGVFPKP